MSNSENPRITILCDSCEKCPTLERQENQISIQDDFGGKVILTGSQWNMLVQMIEQKQFAAWTFESSNQ